MTRGALDTDEPRRLCPADALPDLLNARAWEILRRQQPEPGVPAGNTEDFPLTQQRQKTEAIKLQTSGSSDPKQWVSWQTFHFTQGETELRWEMWPDPGPRTGGCNLNPSAGLLTPSGKSYHVVSGTCVSVSARIPLGLAHWSCDHARYFRAPHCFPKLISHKPRLTGSWAH